MERVDGRKKQSKPLPEGDKKVSFYLPPSSPTFHCQLETKVLGRKGRGVKEAAREGKRGGRRRETDKQRQAKADRQRHRETGRNRDRDTDGGGVEAGVA